MSTKASQPDSQGTRVNVNAALVRWSVPPVTPQSRGRAEVNFPRSAKHRPSKNPKSELLCLPREDGAARIAQQPRGRCCAP